MSNVVIETTKAKLVSDDGSSVFEICHAYSIEETSGQPLLLTHIYMNGVLIGTPTRFKTSGNLLGMDTPGVGDGFVKDGNNQITNG